MKEMRKRYENTDPKCNLPQVVWVPQVVTVHRKWEAVMEGESTACTCKNLEMTVSMAWQEMATLNEGWNIHGDLKG